LNRIIPLLKYGLIIPVEGGLVYKNETKKDFFYMKFGMVLEQKNALKRGHSEMGVS
jgi:hypothetical protein